MSNKLITLDILKEYDGKIKGHFDLKFNLLTTVVEEHGTNLETIERVLVNTNTKLNNILVNGTLIPMRAYADEEGNIIKDTYATKSALGDIEAVLDKLNGVV